MKQKTMNLEIIGIITHTRQLYNLIIVILLKSHSGAMKRTQKQEFQYQIRKKHKQNMFNQIRNKIISFDHPNSHLYTKETQEWLKFCHHPQDTIPLSLLNVISTISPKPEQLDSVICNLSLNRAINILFMAQIAKSYHYLNIQFFQNLIRLLPHAQRIPQYEIDNLAHYSRIKNYQELNMLVWIQYLSKLSEISQQTIKTISYYFFQYWNNEDLTLSYELCSQLCLFLIKYQDPQSIQQIRYVSVELMRECSSLSTYKLMAKMISFKDHNQTLTLYLLEDKFKQFIIKGTKTVELISPTLQIINSIIQCYNFYQHIEEITPQLITNLSHNYITNEQISTNLQRNIVNIFYNMIYSDLPGLHKTFITLDYQQICAKTRKENFWDFLDLITSLIKFTNQKQLYQMFFGEQWFRNVMTEFIGQINVSEDGLESIKSLLEIIKKGYHQNFIIIDCSQWIEKIISEIQNDSDSKHQEQKEQIFTDCNDILTSISLS